MKLFFCWEQTSRNPAPAMYHGNPPIKSINGGGVKILSGPHELSPEEAETFLKDECFGSWLFEKYPPPVQADA